MAALNLLLNFLFPPRCAGCATRLAVETTSRVCAICLAGIERISAPLCICCGIPFDSPQGPSHQCGRCLASPPRFGKARSVARYRSSAEAENGTLAAMIRRHKYGLDQSLAHALAQCLGDELPVQAADYDLIVPVPLHRRRLRWRGFNQAALLADAVARRLGGRLEVGVLARIRPTPPQTAQDLESRTRNVRGAFAVRQPARVKDQRLLLVDDVFTTGATVNECARVLRAAGARSVDVLTLARAL